MVDHSRQPEVMLQIEDKQFDAFAQLTWSELYDGVSTLDLEAPWDPSQADALQAFAPLSMVPVTLIADHGIVYSGVSLDPNIITSDKEISIVHTSYSQGGKLQDVSMPPESFPLEWVNAPLKKIGDDVCAAFGLEFDAGLEIENEKFKRATLKSEDSPWEFLAELAKQKDALLATTRTGGVAMFRAFKKTEPLATLIEGEAMLTSIAPRFNSREYYSDITCTSGTKLGRKGGRATTKNTLYKGDRRPLIKTADKSDRGDLNKASSAAVGRMFGGAAGWRVVVPTWFMDNGWLWENGRFVTVHAPSCYIRRRTDLLIRGTTFVLTKDSWWAELDLVLADSFTDQIPTEVPWLA